MSEKRIDPEDGKAYTFDDLAEFYKGKFKKKAMLKYWENTCTPAKGKKGKAKAKADPKAKAKAAPAPAVEKRIDPAYGEAYTLDEVLLFYKGKFNKKACYTYWEDECKPVKGKKGAAKAKAAPKAAPEEPSPTEKRKDPADGQVYTFQEYFDWSKQTRGKSFRKKACISYWEKKCELVGKKAKQAAAKAAGKAKAKAAPAKAAAPEEEKKIDPAYGEAYTYKELLSFYKGQFNKSQCKAYWEDECKPVKGKKGKAKAEAKAKAKAAPTAAAVPEGKRKDPEDGKVYTFEAMVKVYKEKLGKSFKKKALLKYWEDKCTPVGKKGKGKGKAEAPTAAAVPEGKRKDPEDGKVYTFETMVKVYKEKLGKSFKKKALLKYWEDKCTPVGKKGKGKGKDKAEPKAKAKSKAKAKAEPKGKPEKGKKGKGKGKGKASSKWAPKKD